MKIRFLNELTVYGKSWDNLMLSFRKFHKFGPKYLTELSPYDAVLHLGRDKISDPLSSYGVAHLKKGILNQCAIAHMSG